MADAYPKSKYRGILPGEQGDLRDPGYASSFDRWPYVSVVVNNAAEEAALDPGFTWVDSPSQITGADAGLLAGEPSYP
jgi:hypothetical protein